MWVLRSGTGHLIGDIDFVVVDDRTRGAKTLGAEQGAGRSRFGGGISQEGAVNDDRGVHDVMSLAVHVGNDSSGRVFGGVRGTVGQRRIVVSILTLAIGVAGTELGSGVTQGRGDIVLEDADVPDVGGGLGDIVKQNVQHLGHTFGGEGIATLLDVDQATIANMSHSQT